MISDELGRVITGNGATPYYAHASLPVTAPWTKDVTVFGITNDPTAVQFDKLFDQGEAYPQAASEEVPAIVRLSEHFEDNRLLFRRYQTMTGGRYSVLFL